MNDENIKKLLDDYARRYPPLLSVQQAMEIADVPAGTIYTWSSLGQISECKSRVGKRLRIGRDCLVWFLLSGGGTEEA